MKQIIFNEEANKKLRDGVNKLNDAVSITFGPRGRNVTLEAYGLPKVVHDGITVAKDVVLKDKFENMGASIVREASSKTNDSAGDGTTTAVILATAIVNEGMKNITAGSNPMILRKGLEKATKVVVDEIAKISKKIKNKEEKIQIATISAQSEEIGKLVADAMEKVGDNGVITVDEGRGNNIVLEYKEGMQFDRGYLSMGFVTNDKMEALVENPYILVTDYKISTLQGMESFLDKLMSVSKDLVIIAEDVDGDALTSLVVNKLRGFLNVLAVKAPAFGDNRKEILEDIATLTGATYISEERGFKLEAVTFEDLGRAEKVISNKDTTTIVGGKGVDLNIKNRIKMLSNRLKEDIDDYQKDLIKERIAKLSGGVAVIKVGASTEPELKELKLRVEDAVSATKSAVEEGIVAGGGITFLKVREAIKTLKLEDEEMVGAMILYRSLEEPIRKLLINSGVSTDVLGEIKKGNGIGYNVISMRLSNMIEDGVIDPAKVLRSAIENAVSSAIMILTTGCVIVEDEKEK